MDAGPQAPWTDSRRPGLMNKVKATLLGFAGTVFCRYEKAEAFFNASAFFVLKIRDLIEQFLQKPALAVQLAELETAGTEHRS